jgi:UV DNA damage repair endonuclease
VLASESDAIVERSILEFEYHADLARWMGFGKSFQDFKINIHISGKRGAEGMRAVHGRLSPEARNCITVENEENSHGLDTCLSLSDIIPTVLDIHHYWIREGDYLDPGDARISRILNSWRGIRPTMHYSCSREDYLVGHDATVRPDYQALLAEGRKKQKLRAHSDFFWNQATNQWAAQFSQKFDIMCEAKGKNLASAEFAQQVYQAGFLNQN